MKITKYISANVLSIFGMFLLLLFLLFLVTSFYYDGTNALYGLSLIENSFFYSVTIICLFFVLLIEIVINKCSNNKYLLTIKIKNKDLHDLYNMIFWLGFISSFLYIACLCYIISIL
jgi:hypothetical protein